MGQHESQAHDHDRNATTAGEGHEGGEEVRKNALPGYRFEPDTEPTRPTPSSMPTTSGEEAAGAADYDRPPTGQPARDEAVERGDVERGA